LLKFLLKCAQITFQLHIHSVQNYCLDNGMKLNSGKITIISFTRKKTSIYFNCKLQYNLDSMDNTGEALSLSGDSPLDRGEKHTDA
jgi:hypothetical protein